MNDLAEAAVEIHAWLRTRHVPHLFIGGFAVQYWGEPRATADVDLTIVLSAEEEEQVIRDLIAHFRPRLSDAAEYAIKNRVLLVFASNGCGIDITLADPWFENDAVARAVNVQVLGHKTIPITSAEDLIVYKAVAHRATDTQDIASIIVRQGRNLKLAVIRKALHEFAMITDDDEPTQVFERVWRKYGSTGHNT